MSNYSPVFFTNNLASPILVCDSFMDDPADKSLANFFGSQTPLGTVGGNSTNHFTPIHGPISTFIVYDSDNNPVTRVYTLGDTLGPIFSVKDFDVIVMTDTKAFVQLMQDQPSDPLVQQFNALIKGGKVSSKAVDDFFANSVDYCLCTFISYMLAVVAIARTPATSKLPPDKQTFNLGPILQHTGTPLPASQPDIVLSQFHCTETSDQIQLGGELNLKDLTLADGVIDHVLAILPSETVHFSVVIDTAPGLAVGTIQLQCVFDNLTIPVGSDKIEFDEPTVLLTISPLFKFVVFEIHATIPFSLFGSPTFNAIVAMTIDNVEAEIGVTLDGNGHNLLTPPGIKGLHFDQFGVGMGLFFEPPGFALGVEGKFHIGDGNQVVQLDDDQFAVVCQLEEEVPNPLFLSFYVPQLSLDQIVTLFTNQSNSIDIPIQFSDLSFHWAENPMEAVTLPDGTLAPMGFGFSAAMDLFGLGFYADLSLDLNDGVQGLAQLAPFSLGPVLSLTGDGAGVTLKVDANGNPIRNNIIPRTAAAKQAIDQATTKQQVAPGGAQLQVSTSKSPYFHLDARLAFLNFHDKIDASIDSNGIHFELDFGSVISGTMSCTLQDYHNFTGRFVYGPDYNISLPLNLGHIVLTAQIDTTIKLTTSTNDVVFSASGGFDFEGISCQIGPFNLDIDITSIDNVLSAIEKWIVGNAGTIFGDLVNDAGKWATAVYDHVIEPAEEGVEYVVNVLKNIFNKAVTEIGDLLKGSYYELRDVANALKNIYDAAAGDVARALSTAYQATANAVSQVLRDVGYAADQVADALKSVYNFTAQEAAQVLKDLGYAANDIANALKSAYNFAAQEAAQVLKDLGYAANDIAHAMTDVYSFTSQAVASVLRGIGYGAEDVARVLSNVFGLVPDAVNSILQGVGYAASEVESAFKSIGGAFASFAENAWDTITHDLNPGNW